MSSTGVEGKETMARYKQCLKCKKFNFNVDKNLCENALCGGAVVRFYKRVILPARKRAARVKARIACPISRGVFNEELPLRHRVQILAAAVIGLISCAVVAVGGSIILGRFIPAVFNILDHLGGGPLAGYLKFAVVVVSPLVFAIAIPGTTYLAMSAFLPSRGPAMSEVGWCLTGAYGVVFGPLAFVISTHIAGDTFWILGLISSETILKPVVALGLPGVWLQSGPDPALLGGLGRLLMAVTIAIIPWFPLDSEFRTSLVWGFR
jgi:hypothetical protein